MKESKFQKIIIDTLNGLDNCFCFKNEIRLYGSGKPDLTITYKGKTILCEVKTGTNKPTILQKAYMFKAINKGIKCCVFILEKQKSRYNHTVLKKNIIKCLIDVDKSKEMKIHYYYIKGVKEE